MKIRAAGRLIGPQPDARVSNPMTHPGG